MGFTIALAGKGGTGKTTTAALWVRALRQLGAGPVLAVDADPNATLHEALGECVERTVGQITEDLMQTTEHTPGGMSKESWLELHINQYLVESREFDLLAMGRPEGAGCYCFANNLVRSCIDNLSRGYEHIVMDNEAGLEHLSRRTTRNVDVLLIVSDPSVRGIRTAGRLSALADELDVDIKARYLIVSRTDEPLDPALTVAAAETGLEILGTIPDDPGITACDRADQGLFDLPGDSPALAAVLEMVRVAIPSLRSTQHA